MGFIASAARNNQVLYLIVCAAGMTCIAGAFSIDERPELRMVADSDTKNLGVLGLNSEKECTFVIKNHGRANATVGKIWTSCGCTGAKSSREQVEPGESIDITATIKTSKTEEELTLRNVYVQFLSGPECSDVVGLTISYSSKY